MRDRLALCFLASYWSWATSEGMSTESSVSSCVLLSKLRRWSSAVKSTGFKYSPNASRFERLLVWEAGRLCSSARSVAYSSLDSRMNVLASLHDISVSFCRSLAMKVVMSAT